MRLQSSGHLVAGLSHTRTLKDNGTLTLTNVQAAQQGYYDALVGNSVDILTSSSASFTLVTPPVITAQTMPTNLVVMLNTNMSLGVTASTPGQTNGFPLSYQWQFNGTSLAGATHSNYAFTAVNSGTYSVVVSNAAGGTNVSWQVAVLPPSNVSAWGDNRYGESTAPLGLTNISAIAAGEYHCVAVGDNGAVVQWGYNWGAVPADLTNAVAVAAGYEHSIAVRSDGTVETWGASDAWVNYVPTGLAGVKAVAAGWDHNVALLTNGMVTAWGFDGEIFGFGLTDVPEELTNAIAISAQALHSLALQSDGTVVGWGEDSEGANDAPAGLSNVVAVAAGGQHSLALKADGTVVAWGFNGSGQCNVPVGLSNVMAIAAGWEHSVALKNDGTVVSWGDNSAGETNTPTLNGVKLIAAGGNHTIAGIFSPLVQYPVDVTKDLLLVYNSSSVDSSNLCYYYLAHRPMVSNANVLGLACDVGEFFTNSTDWDAQLVAPVLTWLTNNPTKHPEYIILFYDIPTRLWLPGEYGCGEPVYSGSVSYHLQTSYPGWSPFVNHINAGTLADCEAYVDKLASFGTNSPGKLIISASAGGYGNTNYILDGVRTGPGYGQSDYSSNDYIVTNAITGLIASGVLPSAIIYTNGLDTITTVITNGGTNYIYYYAPQIAAATNVAGYICWGEHSAFDGLYPTDGSVKWSGDSTWWIIETVESFNGTRNGCGQGNFIQWFSSNAFGGTNYSNTPIGAVSHTEEPHLPFVEDSSIYFGLWAGGKNLAICSWNSRKTPFFQAVGDPFVTR